MTQISRRRVLSTFGAMGGAALFTRCGEVSLPESATAADQSPLAEGRNASPTDSAIPAAISPPAAPRWDYARLDPAEVADRAYRIYPEGGCMYAVVGSVVGALADKLGEPFRSFPVDMMRYGEGGVGAWGSLCGVVNGGAALIGLFHSEKPKEERAALIAEFCVWYEKTPLPQYEPLEPGWGDEADTSVAGSLLCHISVARWSEASSWDTFSMEKKERCRRLAAGGASKVVQLLNRDLDGDLIRGALTPEVHKCADCHGKENLGDAMVKMNCATCHQFESKHP